MVVALPLLKLPPSPFIAEPPPTILEESGEGMRGQGRHVEGHGIHIVVSTDQVGTGYYYR